MWDAVKEKLSVEWVKSEIMRTAYGNRETFIAQLDPRVLFGWYLVFSIIPWFFFNRTILIGIVLVTAVVAAMSRVSGLILFMLAFGTISQIVGWGVAALLFGGTLEVFDALSTLIFKLLTVSLASIAVFSSMDPDSFSDGLLALGLPDQFAFGLSYGYRMVPTLLEEYQYILHAYRLRGKQPEKPGFLHVRKVAYFMRLIVRAFYPMILNTAKRIRTTVEGLEIKGYTYAIEHPEVKKLRLAHLSVGTDEIAFAAATVLALAVTIAVGRTFPF